MARVMIPQSPNSAALKKVTETQQLVTVCETLTEGDRKLLLKWFTTLMKPRYGSLIMKLATQSPTLVLVSAAALYSALFSREAGSDGAKGR